MNLCFQDERQTKQSFGLSSLEEVLASLGVYYSGSDRSLAMTYLSRRSVAELIEYLSLILLPLSYRLEILTTNFEDQPFCLQVRDERGLDWPHEFAPPVGEVVASVAVCRCCDLTRVAGLVYLTRLDTEKLCRWLREIAEE